MAAPAKKEIKLTDFCEAQPNTPFHYPEMDTPAPPIERFTYVNLWATWCGPCIEEMPMLQQWDKDLDAAGAPIDLVFISLDQSASDVERFTKQHPDAPPSLHAKSPSVFDPWVASLGLQIDAALPVHLLVSADGVLRCERSGQMNKQYFELLKSMAQG